jgi:hypothetical protein
MNGLTENLIDTSKESDADISALKHTPSGGFGSCRYKMKSLEDNRAEYERLMELNHQPSHLLLQSSQHDDPSLLKRKFWLKWRT